MFLKTKQSGKKQKQTTQPFLPVSLNKLLLKKKKCNKTGVPEVCTSDEQHIYCIYSYILYSDDGHFCGILWNIGLCMPAYATQPTSLATGTPHLNLTAG